MARDITGNAYESRGKWYARVSLGVEIEWKKSRTRRPNVALAHCLDEATATKRATLIADCARSLVQANQLGYVANTIARLGEIDPGDAEALSKAVATVRAIVAGKIARSAPVAIGGSTYGDVARMLTSGELQQKYPDAIDHVTTGYEKDRTKKLAK